MKSLDEVDSVPWSEFNHAHGPATDVPRLLREIAGLEVAGPDGGWIDFYRKLCQQTDVVFPATAEVVPFLAGFLADECFLGDRTHLALSIVDLAAATGAVDDVAAVRSALCQAISDVRPTADPLAALAMVCTAALAGCRRTATIDVLLGGSADVLGLLGAEVGWLASQLLDGQVPSEREIIDRFEPLRSTYPGLEVHVLSPDWFPTEAEIYEEGGDELALMVEVARATLQNSIEDLARALCS